MITGLLAKKLGMTQIFQENGDVVPVTVLEAGPCPVLQVKTAKSDGYNALQLGFLEKRKKNTTKPLLGHFKKAGIETNPRFIREFRLADGEAGQKDAAAFKPGDAVKSDIFEGTYKVTVTGTSKGRGFTGMVKRWNKHRGPESHGSMLVRGPGSIGSDTRLTHIRPAKHMPGRYGFDTIVAQNLEVVRVDKAKNLLFVRGAVPGPTGGLVVVKKTNLVRPAPPPASGKKKKVESKKR